MKRFVLIFIFLALSAASAPATPPDHKQAAETITIPLDHIWASRMPGTRDIQELEEKQFKLTGEAPVDAILGSVSKLHMS